MLTSKHRHLGGLKAAMSVSASLPHVHLQTGTQDIYCQPPSVVDVLMKMPLPQSLIPPVACFKALQPISTLPILF